MKPGKFPGMGGMNMNAMAKQLQKMQQEMAKAQEELENAEYTAQAGGGVVTATVKGTSTLVKLEIKPEAVDPDDVEMLQDLILAAVNEALRTADEASSSRMKSLTGGVSKPGLF